MKKGGREELKVFWINNNQIIRSDQLSKYEYIICVVSMQNPGTYKKRAPVIENAGGKRLKVPCVFAGERAVWTLLLHQEARNFIRAVCWFEYSTM